MVSADICPGMYVRVPYESRSTDDDFRDFRIGRVESVNVEAGMVAVCLFNRYAGSPPFEELVEFQFENVARCRILPASDCRLQDDHSWGKLLTHADDGFEPEQLTRYFVQIDGVVRCVAESELIVASTRQFPDPLEQLSSYELQHPKWRDARDPLIERYAELRNATYGVEELIGSRVLLLPHQAEVVTRVLSDPACRFILADEVGLGKTIEAAVVLKGLFRRDPTMKSLIVVPAALLRQWQNELNDKFWLEFSIINSDASLEPSSTEWMTNPRNPGIIVSHEDLDADDRIWHLLEGIDWGLLVVDEAHHIRRTVQLAERLVALSGSTSRTLILSATPIQRYVEEYLDLLRLMDPARYGTLEGDRFRAMLNVQDRVRSAVRFLTPSLAEDQFDLSEFEDELSSLADLLAGDMHLADSLRQLPRAASFPDRGRGAARDLLAYVTENYRVEGRVIRNRRVHLSTELPERALDMGFSYTPCAEELATLDALAEYVDLLHRENDTLLAVEFGRVLMHAAASSPHQLIELLDQRWKRLQREQPVSTPTVTDLETSGPPRLEATRLCELIEVLSPAADETARLQDLRAEAGHWLETTDLELERVSARRALLDEPTRCRLVQVLRSVDAALRRSPPQQVILFSSWPRTLDALLPRLQRLFGRGSVAQFRVELDDDVLQQQADAFQTDPYCQVLLSDDLGGEGRNFQQAGSIVHVDLPWTPSRIEQRIGRVDRLGRSGVVRSVVPFAIGTLEHDLFRIWQEAFELFTQSMSGLEIALEGVQSELQQAIGRSPRHGLAELLDPMLERVTQLRREVEQERYFEEGTIDHDQRAEFRRLSDTYRDGKLLQPVVMRWADIAGLRHSCDPSTDICSFTPARFNQKSMANAKFFDPPDMQEAMRRSRRRYEQTLRGTFNRDVAVRREDLIFFAPGDDPWFDAIVNNAIEADRGRCCGIQRIDNRVTQEWQGLELLYTVRVDPRPLLSAGFDSSYLRLAGGFLDQPTCRVLLDFDGRPVQSNDPLWSIVQQPFRYADEHLGQRGDGGNDTPLARFRTAYPPDMWEPIVDRLGRAAAQFVAEHLDYTIDAAEEARERFQQRAASWRAVQHWLARELDHELDLEAVEHFEHAAEALAKGIERPLVQLESVCFWVLLPQTASSG